MGHWGIFSCGVGQLYVTRSTLDPPITLHAHGYVLHVYVLHADVGAMHVLDVHALYACHPIMYVHACNTPCHVSHVPIALMRPYAYCNIDIFAQKKSHPAGWPELWILV